MLASFTSVDSRLKVVCHTRIGFTPEENEKHEVACALVEVMANTEEFYTRWMNSDLKRLNGMAKWQAYDLFMSGKEKLSKDVDHEIDVDVEVYSANTNVIGWTLPTVIWTKLNRKYFDQFNYAQVGMNLVHEWVHKLGFDHLSATDYGSLPYCIGYLMRDMINEYLKGAVFTDKWTGESLSYKGATVPGDFQGPATIPYKIVCTRSWKTLFMRKQCRKVYQ